MTKTKTKESKRFSLRYLSITQKLPLLICSLILAVTFTFGLISYLGVRQSAFKVGQERLQAASRQLAGMLSASTESLVKTAYIHANNPVIVQYLQAPDSTRQALNYLQNFQQKNNFLYAEIRNSRNEMILRSSDTQAIPVKVDLLSRAVMDSGFAGDLHVLGDSIFFPVVAHIHHNKELAGYLVGWRKMSARGVEQVSRLMGEDAKFYIGSTQGNNWTDLEQAAPPASFIHNRDGIHELQRSGRTVLASMLPVDHSSWQVSVEFPKHKIYRTANIYLYWLLVAGTIFLAAGILIAWLLSRNLTRPLKKLTHSATQISSGNFSMVTDVNRHDELGKLSRAFNAMVMQVQKSQEELQRKADNYKLLFEKNPMPMWIISRKTLKVLHVNQAALLSYGYTKKEFCELTSLDLRPEEDVPQYLDHLKNPPGDNKSGRWRHKKKDGSIIMVDIVADNIEFEGQEARLVLANDVTEKLRMEAELVQHRIKQQEIITETTIQVQEKEREELGKELHDNINQILASTKLYLELARSSDSDRFPEAISKSYDNVNLVIGEIRHLSKQLVKPSFDSSLADIVKELAEEFQLLTPIEIQLNTKDYEESHIDEHLKLMAYRIIQEQLNNIHKYARAGEVHILLRTDDENLYLTISDNGVGFDMTQKSKGIGLRNIDSRVKFHKGESMIYSSPGKGCRIEISVPLESKPVSMFE